MVKLKAREVLQLEELLRTATDPRRLRRVQALLWLDEGNSVEEVADHLQVTQQTVYNWIVRFSTTLSKLEIA